MAKQPVVFLLTPFSAEAAGAEDPRHLRSGTSRPEGPAEDAKVDSSEPTTSLKVARSSSSSPGRGRS